MGDEMRYVLCSIIGDVEHYAVLGVMGDRERLEATYPEGMYTRAGEVVVESHPKPHRAPADIAALHKQCVVREISFH